jgi:hypothetical protein
LEELRSEIEIDAPPDKVWEVLTDFGSYREWNPFIREIDGQLRPGANLRVHIEPPNRRGTTFKPKVLKVEPNRELRWLGHLLVPGLFDGEHILSIDPVNSTKSHFRQWEVFKGLLVPALRGMLRDTQRGFEQMNRALKQRVEAHSAKSG